MPWAAVDPGASRNACAVAGIDRNAAGMWGPIYLAEIRGERGRPLDLRNVLVPHARAVRVLGCRAWLTDAFAKHDVHHAGLDAGIAMLESSGDLWDQWRHLMAVVSRRKHALAPSKRLPEEQHHLLDVLVEQLATVREGFEGGRRRIIIPEVGTSHGDLATAYARAFLHARAADFEAAHRAAPELRGASSYSREIGRRGAVGGW